MTGEFPSLDKESFADFKPGDNISKFVAYDQVRMDTLILMSRLFFGQGDTESDICHLIESIMFDADATYPNTLVMNFRDPIPDRFTSIRIELRDFTKNFSTKLRNAWTLIQNESDFGQGLVIVCDIQAMWIPA